MAGVHVDLEQHRIVAGLALAQPRHPFGRLPIGDARIGEPGLRPGSADRRARRHCRRANRRRSSGSRLPRRSGCPIPAIPAASAAGLVEHGRLSTSTNGTSAMMPPKAVRRHVGDGAHQHAAGRAALGDDAVMRGVAFGDQMLGNRDEIRETCSSSSRACRPRTRHSPCPCRRGYGRWHRRSRGRRAKAQLVLKAAGTVMP